MSGGITSSTAMRGTKWNNDKNRPVARFEDDPEKVYATLPVAFGGMRPFRGPKGSWNKDGGGGQRVRPNSAKRGVAPASDEPVTVIRSPQRRAGKGAGAPTAGTGTGSGAELPHDQYLSRLEQEIARLRAERQQMDSTAAANAVKVPLSATIASFAIPSTLHGLAATTSGGGIAPTAGATATAAAPVNAHTLQTNYMSAIQQIHAQLSGSGGGDASTTQQLLEQLQSLKEQHTANLARVENAYRRQQMGLPATDDTSAGAVAPAAAAAAAATATDGATPRATNSANTDSKYPADDATAVESEPVPVRPAAARSAAPPPAESTPEVDDIEAQDLADAMDGYDQSFDSKRSAPATAATATATATTKPAAVVAAATNPAAVSAAASAPVGRPPKHPAKPTAAAPPAAATTTATHERTGSGDNAPVAEADDLPPAAAAAATADAASDDDAAAPPTTAAAGGTSGGGSNAERPRSATTGWTKESRKAAFDNAGIDDIGAAAAGSRSARSAGGDSTGTAGIPLLRSSLTTPQPFSFEEREAAPQYVTTRAAAAAARGGSTSSLRMLLSRSITKEKFAAYMAELQRAEHDATAGKGYQFKARPIPASTLLPKYEAIIQQQKQKSEAVKTLTRVNSDKAMKPFEFAASKALADRKAQEKAERERRRSLRADLKAEKARRASAAAAFGATTAPSEAIGGGKSGGKGTAQPLGSTQFEVHTVADDDARSQTGSAAASVTGGSATGSASGGGGFKAKEVPWFVKVQMLPRDEQQKQNEIDKKKRDLEMRAKKKLQNAALPPRMQQHETKRKQQEAEAAAAAAIAADTSAGSGAPVVPAALIGIPGAEDIKVPELLGSSIRKKSKAAQELALSFVKEYTFKPQMSGSIPDFPSEHEKFEEKKREVRKTFAATKPTPFQLTPAKPKPAPAAAPEQFRANPLPNFDNPNLKPAPTTKKHEETKARVAERMEARKLAEDLAVLRREKAAAHTGAAWMKEKLQVHVRDARADLAAKLKSDIAESRKTTETRTNQYFDEVKRIKEDVKKRPLLIEYQKREKDRTDARRKALLAIKDSLDKANVPLKHQRKYFDQDELDDLDLDFGTG